MNRRGHKGRVDGNHSLVMAALRKAGIAVRSTASVGDGFPDLLASVRGVQVLLEVKMPGEKLTEAEQAFRDSWPGPVVTVESPEAAILAVYESARPRGL